MKNRGVITGLFAAMFLVCGCGGGGGGSSVSSPPATGTVSGTVITPVGATTGTAARTAMQQTSVGYAPLSGARVSVSGTSLYGDTDANGDFQISSVSAGTVTLSISKSGFTTIQREVSVTANQTTNISQSADVVMELVQSGSITVTSTPSGADIILDGANTGKTTPNTFTGVAANTHAVTVESRGYLTPDAKSVAVAVEGTGTANFTLVENQSPTADITAPADASSYDYGASITFTGTGTDPDEGALSGTSLSWQSSRDGVLGTGASLATSGLSVGAHTITLTAMDSNGGSHSDSIQVTVNAPPENQSPTADITAPAGGSSYDYGASITFTGAGTDPEDGALSGTSLSWQSSLSGVLGMGASLSLSTLAAGVHTITLTATDSDGGSHSDSIQVTVNTPTTTKKVVLVETFEWSSCSHCSANVPNLEQYMDDVGATRALNLEFRWETSTDWTGDIRDRFTFYGCSSTPSIFVNGAFKCYGNSYAGYEAVISPYLDQTTGYFINVEKDVGANTVQATVTVTNNSTGALENVDLYTAVVEDRNQNTYQSLVRDMLEVKHIGSLAGGGGSVSYDLESDSLVNLGTYDVYIVAWLQNGDKAVLQAARD